jgi:hypothetical protein
MAALSPVLVHPVSAENVQHLFKLYSFVDKKINPVLYKQHSKLTSRQEQEPVPMFLMTVLENFSQDVPQDTSAIPPETKSDKIKDSFLISLGRKHRGSILIVIDDTEIEDIDNTLRDPPVNPEINLELYKKTFIKLICTYPELYEKAFF